MKTIRDTEWRGRHRVQHRCRQDPSGKCVNESRSNSYVAVGINHCVLVPYDGGVSLLRGDVLPLLPQDPPSGQTGR